MAKHEWPEDEEQETGAMSVDTESTVESDDDSTPAEVEDTEVAEDAGDAEDTAEDAEVAEDTGDAEDAGDAEDTAEDAEDTESAEESDAEPADAESAESSTFAKVLAFGLLPALALLLAAGAGYLKWVDNSVRSADTARIESMQVAKDTTVKMLSYKPDTVAEDLGAARDLLTGSFRDDYIKLTEEQVIPGAQQQRISAVASVPAAASVSAEPGHAEALVFVNQTVIVGDGAPTSMASSVKVALQKVGDRWLVSGFDPV